MSAKQEPGEERDRLPSSSSTTDQKPTLPAPGGVSGTSTPLEAGDLVKVKHREACTSCRQTKVKCRTVSETSLPSDVCARCTRLKIPCIYAQAKRGRKAGVKRVPPESSTAADTSLSSSTNSSSRPDYSPNKVQRRSPSHQSPQTDYNHQSQSQPQHPPPPPPPPQSHQQHNSFPQHSFERPAPPPLTNSFFPPGGHLRDSSSSSTASGQLPSMSSNGNGNGNGGMNNSLFTQYPHEGMENSHALPQTNHQRYLPFPSSYDQNNNNPSSSSSSLNYTTPFPPLLQGSSPHLQRRPSETQFHSSFNNNSSGIPRSSHPSSATHSPYLSHTNASSSSYGPPPGGMSMSMSSNVTAIQPIPIRLGGGTNNNTQSPASPSSNSTSSQRNVNSQHQESFLRDTLPAPPPPLPPPAPFDHPSVASSSTTTSEISRTSQTTSSSTSSASRRTIPSMLSIRGLLSEVDEESPKSRVAEPAPSLSVAEVLERKAVIDPEGKVVRPEGGVVEAGTGLNGAVERGRKGKGGRWEDPLGLGLLSEGDVEELFEFFHTRLNVFIDILDVRLHTPLYTRSTSAILFTAILTVASKIRRPTLYPTLLALSNQQLGRAFEQGICEIGLVQSLSILSFWKESNERGSWRRVGYAIRLAFELDLHLEHKRPLPEEEADALKVLDRERTWFQLVCFDRTISDQQNRPQMIQPEWIWDLERWATVDHPNLYCLSDTMLASSLSMMKVLDLSKTIRNSEDDSTRIMLMNMVKADLAKHKEKWTGPNAKYQLHPSCLTMIRFYDRLFTHEVDVLQLSVVSSPSMPSNSGGGSGHHHERRSSVGSQFSGFATSSPGTEQVVAFSNCISSALSVLRYLVSDLPSFLIYAQDAVTLGSASTALWLVKNINRMPPQAAEAVYTVLREATVVCRSVTKDPKDSSAYQSRFFQSLLHVAAASRPPTRPPSQGNSPPLLPRALPSVSGRSNDSSGGQLFDIAEANGPAGVDLMALDQQLDGEGGSGWPFADIVQDPNVSIDEMFADLNDWFPSNHGESLAATSGWGISSFADWSHVWEV